MFHEPKRRNAEPWSDEVPLPVVTSLIEELDDLEAEYQAASALFEKQKEEAMATMKRSEDLKRLGESRGEGVEMG